MNMEFKDLFSASSTGYAKFRPTYPDALFQYLAGHTSTRKLAWDCGTGSGQAAALLTRHFDKVIATDPSEAQLANATRHPQIEYRQATAERSSLDEQSADLITAAQAFHWFNPHDFFRQVRRVGKPGSILAFWCYGLTQISPEIDAVVWRLYDGILGSYWEAERKLVEEGYRNVELPFEEIKGPTFEMTAQWSLDHLIGYLSTWSALQKFIKLNSTNPLETVFSELQAEWGKTERRPVRWTLGLRVARISVAQISSG